MFSRKLFSIVLVLLLGISLLTLSGCGQSVTSNGVDSNDNGNNEEQLVGTGKKYTAKLGCVEPVNGHRTAELRRFAEEVAEATNGEVEIEIFPASQLGTAREMIEGTRLGTMQGVLVPSDDFTGFTAAMAIPGLPFLFPSRDICYDALMDSDMAATIMASLDSVGLQGIGFWESGFKQLTCNYPIYSVGDLAGKKIRTMENPVLIAQYQAINANPVPINFAELYNSLQQKVVDGQENPLGTIYDSKFYEVQDYLIITDHGFLGLALVFNKDWFESLPEEYQEIIRTKSSQSSDRLIELQAEMEAEIIIPEVEKAGAEVIYMSEEARKEFAAKCSTAAKEKLIEMMDEEAKQILEKVEKQLAEYQ